MVEAISTIEEIEARTRPLTEVTYVALKEAILVGQLEPGSRINERELAHKMGTSTTPIKEALRTLERDGLVIRRPRRGTFVSTSVMSSLEEIQWARSALEGVAARLAASKATEDEVKRLNDIIDEMRMWTERGDKKKLLGLNEIFHQTIREIARNDYIQRQVETVHAFDRALRRQALSYSTELDRAYREHRAIFERIVAGDADGAEEAIRHHIRRTMAFVKKEKEERHDHSKEDSK